MEVKKEESVPTSQENPNSISNPNPNSNPTPNPNPNPNQPRSAKAKSCKGCAYYSSVLKAKSKNPTCVGLSRTLQQVPPFVVGQGELEASKEGRKLANFKYACIGYSIYLDNKDSSPDSQDKTAKLPFCVGLEVVSEVNPSAHARKTNEREHVTPPPRIGKPPNTTAEEFLIRFQKNAGIVASGVVKNLNKVGNHHNPLQGNEHTQEDTLNEDVKISDNVTLPSTETDSQKKTKRRKKEHINKASLEGDNGNDEGMIKANKETTKSNSVIHKFSESKEQHQKLTIENVDNEAQDYPEGNQSKDKKAKKKKIKSQGNEAVNSDLPVSAELSIDMMKEDGNNKEDTKPSQVRTLSNGLVIQELETGKENGKIAAVGKKISINYTGKLKENEGVVDSNDGQAPFKFRLGKGEVNESWDIGLEGMQVGEKRRLIIPPSMTSKNDGDNAKIPPNSWLVYDFELVKVH